MPRLSRITLNMAPGNRNDSAIRGRQSEAAPLQNLADSEYKSNDADREGQLFFSLVSSIIIYYNKISILSVGAPYLRDRTRSWASGGGIRGLRPSAGERRVARGADSAVVAGTESGGIEFGPGRDATARRIGPDDLDDDRARSGQKSPNGMGLDCNSPRGGECRGAERRGDARACRAARLDGHPARGRVPGTSGSQERADSRTGTPLRSATRARMFGSPSGPTLGPDARESRGRDPRPGAWPSPGVGLGRARDFDLDGAGRVAVENDVVAAGAGRIPAIGRVAGRASVDSGVRPAPDRTMGRADWSIGTRLPARPTPDSTGPCRSGTSRATIGGRGRRTSRLSPPRRSPRPAAATGSARGSGPGRNGRRTTGGTGTCCPGCRGSGTGRPRSSRPPRAGIARASRGTR